MSTNDYHFVTHWRVKGTLEEVYNIMSNTLEYPRWCPSVYLSVKQIHPGGADHIGRVMQLHTKGRLPYTIRWFSPLAETNRPYGFSIAAIGDFQGRGVSTFDPHAKPSTITYHSPIPPEQPLFQIL